jgi:hypothetical protein
MRRRYMILTMLCLAAIDPSRAFAGDRFVALKAEYETKVKQREAEYEAAYEAAENKGVEALKAFRFDKPHPGPMYSSRFLAIAEEDPNGLDALEAISMALSTNSGATAEARETRAKAFKLLRALYEKEMRRKRHALHSLPPMSSKAQPIAILIFRDKQLDRPRQIFWHCVQCHAVASREISHGDRSSEIG